jgi:hypothetical protein
MPGISRPGNDGASTVMLANAQELWLYGIDRQLCLCLRYHRLPLFELFKRFFNEL